MAYSIVYHLTQNMKEKNGMHLPLAIMTAMLLIVSVTFVPALDAFADHDHGNHKSKDKKDDNCIKKNGQYKKNCPKPEHGHHGHHDD